MEFHCRFLFICTVCTALQLYTFLMRRFNVSFFQCVRTFKSIDWARYFFFYKIEYELHRAYILYRIRYLVLINVMNGIGISDLSFSFQIIIVFVKLVFFSTSKSIQVQQWYNLQTKNSSVYSNSNVHFYLIFFLYLHVTLLYQIHVRIKIESLYYIFVMPKTRKIRQHTNRTSQNC